VADGVQVSFSGQDLFLPRSTSGGAAEYSDGSSRFSWGEVRTALFVIKGRTFPRCGRVR